MLNHEKFYSNPYFYDLAFQFKEVEKESQTLIDLYQKLRGTKPASFLDIAAGPALNAIDMARQGLEAYAIDLSSEMREYALAKAKASQLALAYEKADMRNFYLSKPLDMAAIFMASTGYLLMNEDMIQHLKAVANNLSEKGVYVLEMAHPRDVFAVGQSTATTWTVNKDGVEVSVQFGRKNDAYDPISQTKNVSVRLAYSTPDGSGIIQDECIQREYTFQEMKALVQLSGVFDLKETLGNWDINTPFSNESESWRMILVLQKII